MLIQKCSFDQISRCFVKKCSSISKTQKLTTLAEGHLPPDPLGCTAHKPSQNGFLKPLWDKYSNCTNLLKLNRLFPQTADCGPEESTPPSKYFTAVARGSTNFCWRVDWCAFQRMVVKWPITLSTGQSMQEAPWPHRQHQFINQLPLPSLLFSCYLGSPGIHLSILIETSKWSIPCVKPGCLCRWGCYLGILDLSTFHSKWQRAACWEEHCVISSTLKWPQQKQQCWNGEDPQFKLHFKY